MVHDGSSAAQDEVRAQLGAAADEAMSGWWRNPTPEGAAARLRKMEDLAVEAHRDLGSDDEVSLRLRQQVGALRGLAGDTRQAVVDFQALVVDLTRLYGPDHVKTLNGRFDAANALRTLDPARALAELDQVRSDQERVMGADYSEALHTRWVIALTRVEMGDLTRAQAELAVLADDQARALGHGTIAAVETRELLADLQSRSSRYASRSVRRRDDEVLFLRRGRFLGGGRRVPREARLVQARLNNPSTPTRIENRRPGRGVTWFGVVSVLACVGIAFALLVGGTYWAGIVLLVLALGLMIYRPRASFYLRALRSVSLPYQDPRGTQQVLGWARRRALQQTLAVYTGFALLAVAATLLLASIPAGALVVAVLAAFVVLAAVLSAVHQG
jgi:hypothetical protein